MIENWLTGTAADGPCTTPGRPLVSPAFAGSMSWSIGASARGASVARLGIEKGGAGPFPFDHKVNGPF